MAKRVIEVEIIGDTSKLKKAFDDGDAAGGKFAGGLGKVAKVGGLVGAGLGIAVAVGAKFVKAAEESNKVSAQTNAVLKSTGGAANVTAKEVGNLASTLSRKTAIDDDSIQSASNMLLTFTNVRNEVGKGNDIFTQATKTVLDMSVATGIDATKASVQLGKALNDPIKGISALSRVGVTFTEQQKEQITTMVKAGDTAGAQKIILKELGKEFGGSAEAGKTSSAAFSNAIGNLQESIGNWLLPVVNKVLPKITDFVQGMSDGTGQGGRFVDKLESIARFIDKNVIPVFVRVAKVINATLIPPIRFVVGHLDDLYNAASRVVSIIGKIPGVKALGGALGLIDKKAGGGYSSGGLTLVGEEGPELVSMPRGAYVHTASQTAAMASAGGGIVQHFHGPVGSTKAARVIGEQLAYRLSYGSA